MCKIHFVFILVVFSSGAFAKKKESSLQIAGFIGFSLLNESSTPTLATDGVGTYPATLKSTYENSASGGIELRNLASDAWLFKIGARTMIYRKVISAQLDVSGFGSQPLTILNPYSYRLHTLYWDGGYCWESFYLYLGVSYNLFDFSAPASAVSYRTKGGMGSTFGFGYKIDDNWSIQYAGHVATVSIESGSNYATTDKYIISDAILSLHYGF